ncbi:PIG-L family deacetylase [Flavimarina sp. Hel_I_48]|uniref:PIG-L family deacetylase n=1 Tax=Flavimarina sp. Hel_I_48 TaxID=1392488 RepID=UPI00068B8DDD|nr:PIG-L family deacetylase [Flavimarina sp. Hel_I_48]
MAIQVPEFIAQAPLLNLSGIGNDLGNTLVIAPHPDDETLGCGGLIALLREQSIKVCIAFVTNGAASHPNSKKYPPQQVAVMRKKEAIAAARFLGMDESTLYFLNQPDGGLDAISSEEYDRVLELLKSLLSAQNIQTLVIPYEHDAHSDHRAAWKICQDLAASHDLKLTIIEYPIWLWENGKQDEIPVRDSYNFFRLDITTVLEAKHLAIAAHVTQTTRLIDDDADGFILTEKLLKPFMGTLEYYFFRKKTASETLSQDYFDTLYQTSDDPWNFTKSFYEKSKYEETLKVLKPFYHNILELGCSIGVLSEQLALKCDHLMSVDISEFPLETAKKRCAPLGNIDFVKMDVSKNFPQNTFDLILISEVGYYLSNADLNGLFENCSQHLNTNGHILLVHWTSYVSEYPLSGKEVHEKFKMSHVAEQFKLEQSVVHAAYELMLWKKTGDAPQSLS